MIIADLCFTNALSGDEVMCIEESYYDNSELHLHFPGIENDGLPRVTKILSESLGDQLYKQR